MQPCLYGVRVRQRCCAQIVLPSLSSLARTESVVAVHVKSMLTVVLDELINLRLLLCRLF
jgi:hypothetical protein